MKLALIVEYDGTNYGGFQYQHNANTIQEELEKAITRLTKETIRINGAGRTDAGVHAKGQVVAFDTNGSYDPMIYVKALNHYLPVDIAIKDAHQVDVEFDPRRMAESRLYEYTLQLTATRSPLTRQKVYWSSLDLDVSAMRRAAKFFVGIHDFSKFSAPIKKPTYSTVRQIFKSQIRQSGNIVRYQVQGNAFLPRQVRRMAGALVDVGRGILKGDDLRRMLSGEDTGSSARTLPARGLCLLEVTYPGFPPSAVK